MRSRFDCPTIDSGGCLVLSFFSSEFTPSIFISDDKTALLLMGIVVGLMVGFFEELGWTGFAIPRMRLRYGVLATGLIVGLVWGLWHFILFWEEDSFSGILPLAPLLARLFSWLPAYRVLIVWVYDHTESLFVSVSLLGGQSPEHTPSDHTPRVLLAGKSYGPLSNTQLSQGTKVSRLRLLPPKYTWGL